MSFKYMSMLILMFVLLGTTKTRSDPATIIVRGQAVETHVAGIQVLTDVLTAVPSNKIMVSQAGTSQTYLTDANAVTSWVPIQPDVLLTLTLKQKNTAGGIAVGQVLSHTFASLNLGDDVYDYFVVFQPLLQAIVLDSALQHYVGFGTRWAFQPLIGSTFLFPASVGVLCTPREIAAFIGYYGIDLAASDYKMGLIVHVSDAEPLGNGIGLEMDFSSYGFVDLPEADFCHVALADNDLGSADYAITPAHWNPSEVPDRGYYYWTGTLGRGMNVVLFGGSASGNFSTQLASTPTFPPVAGQGNLGGGAAPDGVKNCSPVAAIPAPGKTCSVPNERKCRDHIGCPPTGCTGVAAASDCYSRTFAAGEPHCGKADSTGQPSQVTRTWTISFSGGISIEGEIGGDSVGGSVGAGAHSEEGHANTKSQPLSVGNGANGCGECAQAFQEITLCIFSCVVHEKKWSFWPFSYECVDETCIMWCLEPSGTSVEHCSRTGCP